MPVSYIEGAQDGHDTYNVTLRNFVVNGERLQTLEQANVVANQYTRNVTFA